jgi:predicted DsbA family dithiol-disulfide isomerase
MAPAARAGQATGPGRRYIASPMSRLLFFHDFASPYCRLALDAVTDAAERTGLRVRPVPFELRPAPEPLPAADDDTFSGELETARELARAWGVTLRTPPLVPRTRKAHEAVAFALHHGGAPAVLRGIYRALWADGLDIARIDLLADVGEAAGLDRDALHVALGLDSFEPDVVREQHAAAAADITAIPVVQFGTARAVGLIPADELVAWIEEGP